MILEDFFRRPSAIVRYRLPPLGPQMDGFCEWLHAQGFSRDVTRQRIWQASHFNQCLRRWGIQDCQNIHGSHAEQFILWPLVTFGGMSGLLPDRVKTPCEDFRSCAEAPTFIFSAQNRKAGHCGARFLRVLEPTFFWSGVFTQAAPLAALRYRW